MWLFVMTYLIAGAQYMTVLPADEAGCEFMQYNAPRYIEKQGGKVLAATCGRVKEA